MSTSKSKDPYTTPMSKDDIKYLNETLMYLGNCVKRMEWSVNDNNKMDKKSLNNSLSHAQQHINNLKTRFK